jgi:hypothetical protein
MKYEKIVVMIDSKFVKSKETQQSSGIGDDYTTIPYVLCYLFERT